MTDQAKKLDILGMIEEKLSIARSNLQSVVIEQAKQAAYHEAWDQFTAANGPPQMTVSGAGFCGGGGAATPTNPYVIDHDANTSQWRASHERVSELEELMDFAIGIFCE